MIFAPMSYGQDFSFVSGAPSVEVIRSSDIPVMVGPLQSSVTNVRIVVTDFADIKELATGQKAVFLGSKSQLEYNGIILKIATKTNNPLVRISGDKIKRPEIMRKYSDNEWFYYGSPGKYVVEFLDPPVNGGSWTSEFIDVEIIGSNVPNIPPTNPGNPGNPTQPEPPADGSYASIRSETAKMVKGLNDNAVANSLIKEYSTAVAGLSGTIDQMRVKVREARRTAFQNVPSRNTNWNNFLLKIDQMMIDLGVDTPEEYKAAMIAYLDGIKDGIR